MIVIHDIKTDKPIIALLQWNNPVISVFTTLQSSIRKTLSPMLNFVLISFENILLSVFGGWAFECANNKKTATPKGITVQMNWVKKRCFIGKLSLPYLPINLL
jgi:hypothetical protein